jgi:hypothetical protein
MLAYDCEFAALAQSWVKLMTGNKVILMTFPARPAHQQVSVYFEKSHHLILTETAWSGNILGGP